MTRFSRAATTSFLVGLSLASSYPALAADGSRSTTLTDAQLDKIVAGSKATAVGDSSAQGDAVKSSAAATSQIGGGGLTGMAVGSASASATGASAVAGSTLVLSLTIQ